MLNMKYMTEKEFNDIKKRIAKGDSRATSDLYLNFRDFMFNKVYRYVNTKNCSDMEYWKNNIIDNSFTYVVTKNDMTNIDFKLFIWKLGDACTQGSIKYIRDLNAKKRKWYRNNVISIDNYLTEENNTPKDADILKSIANATSNDNIEENYINNDESKILLKIINSYKDKTTKDIVKFKLMGYKNKEIAEILNITFNQVLWKMNVFRKYIKENYFKEGDGNVI